MAKLLEVEVPARALMLRPETLARKGED